MRPLFLMAVVLVSACAHSPDAVKSSPPAPSAFDKAVIDGRVILTAQPTLADLGTLKARGIESVFNVRSIEEMNPETLGFDQAVQLDALDIPYQQSPLNSASGVNPEALEAFKTALEKHQGKVLLHCGSGGRASLLYAAYLLKYQGKSPDEALRVTESFGGWPIALEKLTGIPLTVQRK